MKSVLLNGWLDQPVVHLLFRQDLLSLELPPYQLLKPLELGSVQKLVSRTG